MLSVVIFISISAEDRCPELFVPICPLKVPLIRSLLRYYYYTFLYCVWVCVFVYGCVLACNGCITMFIYDCVCEAVCGGWRVTFSTFWITHFLYLTMNNELFSKLAEEYFLDLVIWCDLMLCDEDEPFLNFMQCDEHNSWIIYEVVTECWHSSNLKWMTKISCNLVAIPQYTMDQFDENVLVYD